MQLRRNIFPPKRFDDEFAASNMPRVNKKTIPRHPELLQRHVVPFNPNRRPAAFPSLPLSAPLPSQPVTSDDCSLTDAIESEVSNGCSATNAILSEVSDDCSPTNAIEPQVSDDEGSDFELRFDDDDRVSWSALELSVQCQIFSRLVVHHQPEDVAVLLGLTAEEHTEIRQHHLRRKQFPFVSPDAPEDSVERATQYQWICDYVEAYPLSIQRAARFLQERRLPEPLLGQWTLSSDGSGMLVCSKLQTGSMALCTPSYDSDGGTRAVLATSPEGHQPKSLQPRYYCPLPTKANLPDPPLFAPTQPITQTNVFHPPQSLLDPIDLTVKTKTKRKRRHSLDHVSPTEERPKKASKKNRKPRPAPSETGRPSPPPVGPLASAPGPGAANDQSGSARQQSPGDIMLGNHDEIQATEKKQEMTHNSELMDQDIAPKSKVSNAVSSLSSLCVRLKISGTPKPSISENNALGRVASPRTVDDRTASNEIGGGTAAPSPWTTSIPPHTPMAKSGWDPELMHDSDRFSSTFELMPRDEQERLLAMHPATRNIVQTWLIYGRHAWNRKLGWNRKFPNNRHMEPARGLQWDTKDGGSVLGRALVAQRNLCQELGRSENFFETAHIGEKVVEAYRAIRWQKQAIEKTLAGALPEKQVSEATELCKKIEKDLCDDLRQTYVKRLARPARDVLADRFPNNVIFLDDEPTEVLGGPGSEAQLIATTPQSKCAENIFTSKALGISLETPRPGNLVSELTDPFAGDRMVEAAAEHALGSSPLVQKHERDHKATKAVSDRADVVPMAHGSTPYRPHRSLSVSRPQFSPISEEDARQFAIEFEKEKHGDQADRLIGEAEEQEGNMDGRSPGTMSANKEGTRRARAEHKPTKITLKLSPLPLARASPGAGQSGTTKASAKKSPKAASAKVSSTSARNSSPKKSMQAIETRAQKAYREDKPSSHTRSRVSTPDPSAKNGADSSTKARKAGKGITK
ncbi:hypothetical protein DV735_g3880, partial [Chaetothyriales sp. CBS 134920]